MSASGTPAIEVRGLTKRFGQLVAVDAIDLVVNRGDVIGFLGPNGAGKTTTIRMLLGLIRADAGTARVFGQDPWRDPVEALRSVAGFVEAPTFYDYLTGRMNLELLAGLDGGEGRTRIDGVLDTVGLIGREGDRVRGYSHGMKQRLGVAATLLRDPDLVILDEPTTGLDPPAMRDMRALVRRLADTGRTVLLSSHQMNEVEEICSRVAIIRNGAIVFDGGLAELTERGARPTVLLSTGEPHRATVVAGDIDGLEAKSGDGPGELLLSGEQLALDRLTVALGREGIPIRAFVPERMSLERAFFRLLDDGASLDSAATAASAATPERSAKANDADEHEGARP
ncbi:MAG: ABC transporter ATP-binding protein [Solirubrobacteraceae bacterium]|nr:MAG: ABC transporter ATP-binding protein [Solirubrobacterales bacterium]